MKCEIDVGQGDGSEIRKDNTAVPTDAISTRQSKWEVNSTRPMG
jgi:hypothetical protein